jgi:hypothetical protein
MKKKVSFGGTEVREMSIDKNTHIQEIKNPQNLITIRKKSRVDSPHDSEAPNYYTVVFIILGTLAFLFFLFILLNNSDSR